MRNNKKLTYVPVPTAPPPEPTVMVRSGDRMVWRAQKQTYKPEMVELYHRDLRNRLLTGKSILFQPEGIFNEHPL